MLDSLTKYWFFTHTTISIPFILHQIWTAGILNLERKMPCGALQRDEEARGRHASSRRMLHPFTPWQQMRERASTSLEICVNSHQSSRYRATRLSLTESQKRHHRFHPSIYYTFEWYQCRVWRVAQAFLESSPRVAAISNGAAQIQPWLVVSTDRSEHLLNRGCVSGSMQASSLWDFCDWSLTTTFRS